MPVALAALERLAVDLALIIDDDEIARLRLVLGGGGIEALLAVGEARHRGVDRRLRPARR